LQPQYILLMRKFCLPYLWFSYPGCFIFLFESFSCSTSHSLIYCCCCYDLVSGL